MHITVHHRIPRDDVGLGLVRVEGVQVGPSPQSLADELDLWIDHRHGGTLLPEEEAVRKGARDILRNGNYKPTGRAKPASEYLMRAAGEGNFPRINGPVDANNLVSLKHCVPVSLWDLDLAGSHDFEFRLGSEGEAYVFNAAGQVLDLYDLLCGCGLVPDGQGASQPIVTPIKDSVATKIKGSSTRVAGCVYYPMQAGNQRTLEVITDELLRWLMTCGEAPSGAMALCMAGESVTL